MAQSFEKKKSNVISALREVRIVKHACKKAGISTTTYYRWREEDQTFSAECDKAIEEGTKLWCDLAESNLFNSVRKGDLSSSKYVLEHHHEDYKRRSVNTPSDSGNEILSPYWDPDMLKAAREINRRAEEEGRNISN